MDVSKEKQKVWKELLLLSKEKEGEILSVCGKYHLEKWNKKYLVVICRKTGSEEEKHYLAGPNLKEQEEKLINDSQIRLAKKKKSTSGSRLPYRECVVFRKGEWWLRVDHTKIKKESPLMENIIEVKILEDEILALLWDVHIYTRVCKLRKNCVAYRNVSTWDEQTFARIRKLRKDCIAYKNGAL